MKEFIITRNEAGQRADKLLAKYLKEAPKSFLYKMMRKKNITLNGKKIQGNEQLSEGDVLRLFLAEETIQKFQGEESAAKAQAHSPSPRMLPNQRRQKLDIIYEDSHILIVNKPSGMLSQKAKESDISLNEHILTTSSSAGHLPVEHAAYLKPSICEPVWTGIPADLWRQEKVWQGFRLSQSFFMTGPSIRIIFVS